MGLTTSGYGGKNEGLMRTERVARRTCQLIRAVRREKHIPQTELCEVLGVSQATLSKIENQETEPSVVVWLRFCDLFRIPSSLPLDPRGFDAYLKSVESRTRELASRAGRPRRAASGRG
jgi:DNA-binding XRE family transcriptional regulator